MSYPAIFDASMFVGAFHVSLMPGSVFFPADDSGTGTPAAFADGTPANIRSVSAAANNKTVFTLPIATPSTAEASP